MYHEKAPTIVKKRLSFFSILALCLTAIIVTTIGSAAAIGIYGLAIVDSKADGVVGFARGIIESLPAYRDSLPPALADAIHDERAPQYLEHLDVSVRPGATDRRGKCTAVVQVRNEGEEIVSLLSLRVIGTNEDGDPVFEECAWAATPIQIDDDWRGPLLPHETRKFSVRYCGRGDVTNLEHEVTEVRVWLGPVEDDSAESVKTAGLVD